MEELAIKLQNEVVNYLTQNEQILDDKYLQIGSRNYSRREIASEIEHKTEFGINLLARVMMLSIDLIARGKSE